MTQGSECVRVAADSALTSLRGIGPVRADALAGAGYETVGDLLRLLPARYEDRRRLTGIGSISSEGHYTLSGRLRRLKTVRVRRRRMTLVRGELVDADGFQLPVLWFNRPYLQSQVEEGTEYLVHGAVRRRKDGWELVNPTLEPAETARLAGSIVPVYPSVGGLAPSLVRGFAAAAIGSIRLESLGESLPLDLLEKHQLPSLGEALRTLHAPGVDKDVEMLNAFASPAHHRFVYEELLGLQLDLALIRQEIGRRRKQHTFSDLDATRAAIEGTLPFDLTSAQARAVDEIFTDLRSPYPMMRLLQGDVGCGKTAVAAIVLAAAARSGLQAALMAPTELLAEQHYRSLTGLLGDSFPLLLLTSSAGELAAKRASLRTGSASLAIGTHALIQDAVAFDRLGLVVIDEQHRFGVEQRRKLQLKGDAPDLLVMTATPIPRSLSLTLYGDLDLTVINELPPGRSKVETRVVSRREREEVYGFLEQELGTGSRAYVVLPLIEESDKVAAESIAGLGRELERRFQAFHPALLHGRTPPEERTALMQSFAAGDVSLLIATTLVEVGVDVPEATVMVIESAQRFGLSQLHQLRGRVGRGRERSFCIAVFGSASDESRKRLDVFATESDGFRIAEADLAIRGPGELLGNRQSGVPRLKVSDLVRDIRWLELARHDAAQLLRTDPDRARRLAASASDVAPYERLAGA